MKKLNIFFIAISIALIFSYVYTKNFTFLENINRKFTDIFFELRGFESPSSNIVIVDIDEKSLSDLNGFSRDKLAIMIDHLTKAGAKVIGLDMAFSQKKLDKNLIGVLQKAPVVLGYMVDFSSNIKKGEIPNNSSIIFQSNYKQKEFLPIAKGIISNISSLQNSVSSSGFINMISDEDGITRSIPLVVKYNERLYTSLALEMVKAVKNSKKISIDYSDVGINEITLDEFVIATDRFGRLMLNYKGKSKFYKYISADKIYNNKFNEENIKGKIVLIGASTSRFHDLRATPYDSTFAGVEVHANAIDNIINHNFLTKPNWIEVIDLGILFILLFFIAFFSCFGPIKNALFSLSLIVGYFYIALYVFITFGLTLNVVFPLSASLLLYIILSFIHYVGEVKQKDKLNRQLINEMQNRQDLIQEEVLQRTLDLNKALKEKTIFLRELHHRVKNNLQLILSITRLQQYVVKDKTMHEELNKLQTRIKAIAKTHEILCSSENIDNVDMGEYIGQLCEEMENSIVSDNIEIVLNARRITFPLRQAVYIGLIINEIVSNSIKYAFDNENGKIFISLSQNDEEYVLKIGDNGKGYDNKSTKSSSLGLKLVDALVVDQLDGTIDVRNENGLEYIIKFKASDEK